MKALKSCRQCGAKISPDAKTCPHCGVESPGESTWVRLLMAVSAPGFLTAAAVLYFAVKCSAGPPDLTPAQRAAQQQARAQADATCRTDAVCWGRQHVIAASVACKRTAERRAKYTARWPDIGLADTFAPIEWLGPEHHAIAYIGQAEFQNGFGAWTPYVVRCQYDPSASIVLNVDLIEGRL